jgi:hypothetical protein
VALDFSPINNLYLKILFLHIHLKLGAFSNARGSFKRADKASNGNFPLGGFLCFEVKEIYAQKVRGRLYASE